MIYFLLILIGICSYKIRVSHFHPDYMDRYTTTSIKGFFAVIILLSHMRGYLRLTAPLDVLYNDIFFFIGQSMVAMFFFYSGYGIFEAYKNRRNYSESFFRKRIFKTLVHFDLAVFLFLISETLFEHFYPLHNYIYCWIGWENIGNSNWFIFDILVLYFIAYIGMLICKLYARQLIYFVAIVSSLVIVLWVLFVINKKGDHYWYDTLFCFPAGMFYSFYKKTIEYHLVYSKYNIWKYFVALLFLVSLYAVFAYLPNAIRWSLETFTFCFLLIIVSMKIKIGNQILFWLGTNAFSIYILQRLPMSILAEYGLNRNNMVFSLLAIPIVLFVSCEFTKITNIIDSRYFK